MLIKIIVGIIVLILAIIWINWSKKKDKAIRRNQGNWIRTRGRR